MLEEICTDLETSKKLKELGIAKDSPAIYFYSDFQCGFRFKANDEFVHKNLLHTTFKTYTLEQILEMLPKYLGYCHEEKYFEFCHPTIQNCMIFKTKDESLATTAARLLIKLIEDKIITNPLML